MPFPALLFLPPLLLPPLHLFPPFPFLFSLPSLFSFPFSFPFLTWPNQWPGRALSMWSGAKSSRQRFCCYISLLLGYCDWWWHQSQTFTAMLKYSSKRFSRVSDEVGMQRHQTNFKKIINAPDLRITYLSYIRLFFDATIIMVNKDFHNSRRHSITEPYTTIGRSLKEQHGCWAWLFQYSPSYIAMISSWEQCFYTK